MHFVGNSAARQRAATAVYGEYLEVTVLMVSVRTMFDNSFFCCARMNCGFREVCFMGLLNFSSALSADL